MLEGTILRFHCQTTSPFHTTRQRYANLVKCAPFIMGSTLRGAVLDALIRTRCPPELIGQLRALNDPEAIAKLHRDCPETCSVKSFFASQRRVWFSFAKFDAQELDYRMMTRIGLSRETLSVSEGAIFTIEAITPGVPFDFEVTLLAEAQAEAEDVMAAVEQVAAVGGIGGFRSIGLGRFELVGEPERTTLDERLYDAMTGWPRAGEPAQMTFTTPFVLGSDMEPQDLQGDVLAQRIAQAIDRVAAEAGYEGDGALPLERVDVRLKPEFVGRFSFERGLRENQLVAWPGSSLGFAWPETVDEDALAIAAVLGIGEWNHWGFGRFRLQEGAV
ncbi:MAG: hypothetical protein H8D78_21315 [Chloroflexi bacterium]|nr:hypothetical protein [Chloroflexota bacterium]